MARNLGNLALPARCAGIHAVATGVEDCVCTLDARSAVVEHQVRSTAVAVVLRGSFCIDGSDGAALATAGALLLKNAGSTHAYRHVDDGGDRSVTFELDDTRPFRQLAIPASTKTAAAVALVEHALASGDRELLHDATHAVAELAYAVTGDTLRAPSSHARRVVRVLRAIDADPAADCSLANLAALAGLSHFHFARTFRALVGQTPRQYVIAARLRTAAAALATTRKPITEVALDTGFADLSNFVTTFRRAFGVSPRRYRQITRASP